MGRSIHSVEGLIPPLLLVDERLVDIPPGGKLHVQNEFFKMLVFLKADHEMFMAGRPVLAVHDGDVLVQPFNALQIYKSHNPKKASKMHILRLLFQLPMLPQNGARKKSKSVRPRGVEAQFTAFVENYLDNVYHLSKWLTPRHVEVINRLRLEVESKPPGYRFRIGGICMDLIVETVRAIHAVQSQATGDSPTKAMITVQRTKEFMIENLSRQLSLEDIAWHVRLSREHLARIFREITGQTVFEYLTFLRIEAAKNHLYDTSFLVHEIAERTGFTSASLFGRVFKRMVGMTPQGYRNRRMGEVRYESSSIK